MKFAIIVLPKAFLFSFDLVGVLTELATIVVAADTICISAFASNSE
ncbi:hypothetical protein [Sphingomonas sp.]